MCYPCDESMLYHYSDSSVILNMYPKSKIHNSPMQNWSSPDKSQTSYISHKQGISSPNMSPTDYDIADICVEHYLDMSVENSSEVLLFCKDNSVDGNLSHPEANGVHHDFNVVNNSVHHDFNVVNNSEGGTDKNVGPALHPQSCDPLMVSGDVGEECGLVPSTHQISENIECDFGVNNSIINVECNSSIDSSVCQPGCAQAIKPVFDLLCSAANVRGLQSKLELGILDEYIAKFGIFSAVETNTDSPCLANTAISDFKCHPKEPPSNRARFKHGGYHGISILYNPEIIIEATPITDLMSESVLWMKVNFKGILDFIYGAVYIPCETSPFFNKDAFIELENDVLELKVRYEKLPVMLAGDINGHTGTAEDHIEGDDTVAELTGCEILNSSNAIKCSDINPNCENARYSQDTHKLDKNGVGLLSFCKSTNFRIVNGRIGRDKCLGLSTCHKTENPSVIDYLIVSEDMLPYISDFKVEMFDNNISDVHSPIEFTISYDEKSTRTAVTSEENNNVVTEIPLPHMKFQWSPDIANDYQETSHRLFMEASVNLEEILKKKDSITQEDVENLCLGLNNILINSAHSTGAYKEMKPRNSKKQRKRQPWLDHDAIQKRKEYYRVKNKLKRLKNKSMCNKKAREFRKFIKNKKKEYHDQLNKKIRTLRTKNCKAYWDLLNQSTEGNKARSELCIKTLLEHFKKLSQSQEQEKEDNFDDLVLDSIFETGEMPINQHNKLDIAFEIDEIVKIIRGLKNNKSAGLDLLKNEFLKNTSPETVKFICKLFNIILETGFIPDAWCKGLIMPLYKNKGKRDNPDNYRGITLLSCLGKLFTACLSSRIADFMYTTGNMGEEQAGFRPEYSTMDHIFTLHGIIDYYLQMKGRVYVAFVDYTKAFDLIDRSSLWLKLIKNGVKGKILNVIHNMYNNAKSCVKSGNVRSELFSCNVGVRQGENLSPILFAIYLNDFSNAMSQSYSGLESLEGRLQEEMDTLLKLYVLLYADDTIVMAESAEQLQKALDALNEYCDSWALTVNISKTNVIIFSRGKVRKYPKFYLGKNEIKVVDDYVYLGVTFNYDGSFKKAIDKQITQARKAMFALLNKTRALRLPFDIVVELFNLCIVPILLYGAEIWGFEDTSSIEIFHRQFLRTILKSYKFTPNVMLYGESGEFDMKTIIEQRMVNFWGKLWNGKDQKISTKFCKFMCHLQGSPCIVSKPDIMFNFKWCDRIMAILGSINMSVLWSDPTLFSNKHKQDVSTLLKSKFKSQWCEDLNSNSQCSMYKIFKSEHCREKYLTLLDGNEKYAISKFRMRVHNLPITKSRFSHDVDVNLSCNLCNSGEVGDEYHYLFSCPFFNNDRKSLFPNDLTESRVFQLFKWQFAFKEEVNHLTKLSIFCSKVMSNFVCESKPLMSISKEEAFVLTSHTTRVGRKTNPPSRLYL